MGGADEEDAVMVGNTETGGCVEESTVMELISEMPVMYVRAVQVQPECTRTSVGDMRNNTDIFECPVYNTTQRGDTFVFTATLGTMDPAEKWVRSGVCLL